MKIIAFTLSTIVMFSLTGCGQLTKMLQDQVSANTTKISGQATLHNQTNHSGITIKMGKQVQTSSIGVSAKSVTTSFTTVATTGSTGVFSFDVTTGSTSQSLSFDTGMYTVVFSKEGYESVTVDNVPVVFGQSVYNMDDVELKVTQPSFTLQKQWINNGNPTITLTNSLDRYVIESYNNEPVDSSCRFFVGFGNSFQIHTDIDHNLTWQELTSMTFGDKYEGETIMVGLREGSGSVTSVKIKFRKIN